jgi:hypothetical protein
MSEAQETIPKPGSPEYAKALAVAQKIEAMANKPVDDLVRGMVLMGFGSEHRVIVLEQMARHALILAAKQ